MIQSNSVRKIIENLNSQKNDILLLQDRIVKNHEKFSDPIKSSGFTSQVLKSLEILTNLYQSTENLIEFWTIIYNLKGGARFRHPENWILMENGNLKVDLTTIGLKILQSKPAKAHNSNPPQMSLSEEMWLDLQELLIKDMLFLESVQKMREFRTRTHDERISKDLDGILEKFPNLTEAQKKSYRQFYRKTGLSVEEFIHSQAKTSKTDTRPKEKIPENMENSSDFDNYQTYLIANERELARMKRTGEYSVRKRGKTRKRGTSE